MKIITKPDEAFLWLCHRAEKATTYRAVNPTIDLVYDFAKEDFGNGKPMAKLDLKAWLYISESITGPTGYGLANLIKKPVAIFLSDLLGDLAHRGRQETVSVEQAILTMICALDWLDKFKVVQPTYFECGHIRSRRQFEIEHSICLKIPVNVPHPKLHFCQRSDNSQLKCLTNKTLTKQM